MPRLLRHELIAQAIQAIVDRQCLATFVHDTDLHHQMGRQSLQAERIDRNPLVAVFLQRAGECRQEGAIPERQLLGHFAGRIGCRHQAAANVLGSDRIKAVIFSSRCPGTSQSISACEIWLIAC